jgi:hypothetical protein
MIINKKWLVLKSTLFIVISIFVISCDNETHKDESKVEKFIKDSSVAAEAEDPTYALPSPLQIAFIFKKSGMNYKVGLTSQMQDPTNYTCNLSKELNLGIYSADLSYALLNKQNQEVITYMKLSRQLSNYLGIGSVYETNNFNKRFENNIDNEDSLTTIISELQMEMDFYLSENSQQQITSVAFAGAWIESLHIAAKVYEKKEGDVLNEKLSEQMGILKSVINSLKPGEKKDPTIAVLLADLQGVQDLYNSFSSVKNNLKTEATDEKKAIMTKEELVLLTNKIEELRTKFINW